MISQLANGLWILYMDKTEAFNLNLSIRVTKLESYLTIIYSRKSIFLENGK